MAGLDSPSATRPATTFSASVSASQPNLGRRRGPRIPRRMPSVRSKVSVLARSQLASIDS